VAWGFLSSLQRDCKACGGGVLLVSVWSSWGKRERERAREKTNSKTFFPCCTSKGKRRTVPFKTTPFQASPFFFMGTQKWVTTILFVLTLNIVVK
jgi:hypothetical protein